MAFPDNAITKGVSGPRLAAITIDGLGQAARLLGPDRDLFTITDNGTGDWTVTLVNSLQTIPYVFAPMSLTANICLMYYNTAQPSVSAIRILSNSVGTSPTATDSDVQLIMILDQSPTQYNVER